MTTRRIACAVRRCGSRGTAEGTAKSCGPRLQRPPAGIDRSVQMNPVLRPSLLLCAAIAAITLLPAFGAPGERRSLEVLRSNSPPYERAQACRELARVGNAEAIAPLAAVLADETLSSYAREALEVIPHPEAAAALRAALPTLQGHLLVGVINSLGNRRDTEAVPALAALARDSAPDVADAALIALGRIGTASTSDLLQQTLERGSADRRNAAAEGLLLVAQRFTRQGELAAAVPLYDALRGAPIAAQLRASATRGAILARGATGLPLWSEQLRSRERALRDIALATLRDIPGAAATTAVIKELAQADPSLQVLLIGALVDRPATGVCAAIEAMVASPAENVRVAALEALGDVGGNSSTPLLLKATSAASDREAAAALASLVRLRARDVQSAILQFLPLAVPAQAARLISVIGERNDPGAAVELLKLARNPETTISKAALRAMALAARPEDVPDLARMAASLPDPDCQTLAARALVTAAVKVPDVQERTDLVVRQLEQAADAETRFAVLLPLGVIVRSTGGNERALAAVRTALADAAPNVREAALRTLANWPNAAPCQTLLDFLTRNGISAGQRETAVQAVARMAGDVAAKREQSSPDPLAVFQKLDASVRSKDEKIALIAGLAKLNRVESLRLLSRHLDDPVLQPSAAAAVIKIAPALLANEYAAEVKSVLRKIVAGESDEETRQSARRLLESGSARELRP